MGDAEIYLALLGIMVIIVQNYLAGQAREHTKRSQAANPPTSKQITKGADSSDENAPSQVSNSTVDNRPTPTKNVTSPENSRASTNDKIELEANQQIERLIHQHLDTQTQEIMRLLDLKLQPLLRQAAVLGELDKLQPLHRYARASLSSPDSSSSSQDIMTPDSLPNSIDDWDLRLSTDRRRSSDSSTLLFLNNSAGDTFVTLENAPTATSPSLKDKNNNNTDIKNNNNTNNNEKNSSSEPITKKKMPNAPPVSPREESETETDTSSAHAPSSLSASAATIAVDPTPASTQNEGFASQEDLGPEEFELHQILRNLENSNKLIDNAILSLAGGDSSQQSHGALKEMTSTASLSTPLSTSPPLSQKNARERMANVVSASSNEGSNRHRSNSRWKRGVHTFPPVEQAKLGLALAMPIFGPQVAQRFKVHPVVDDVISAPQGQVEDPVDIPYFTQLFSVKDYSCFYGVSDKIGPVVVLITVQLEGFIGLYRNYQSDFVYMGTLQHPTVDLCLKTMRAEFPDLVGISLKIRQGWGPSLLKYEQALTKNYLSFKCGVLLYKKGQDQNQMFSNGLTANLTEFLDLMAKKIILKNWSGYTAGLDTKNNSTGENSYFCTFSGVSTMLHVCGLLPFSKYDEQQLERKRHIGNDITILVFTEDEEPFNPEILVSEVNHVFFVVRAMYEESENRFKAVSQSTNPDQRATHYQLGIAMKPGLRKFGPMPLGVIFKKDENFRKFLLTKLLNAERAAFTAPAFAKKLQLVRKQMLLELESNNKK